MANINLNGSTITFAQDDKLSFNEEEHIYSLDGHKYTSVSNVVGSFFKEFDAEYWSMRKCNGDCKAAAKLREEWNAKGQKASQAGTFLHKQIEDYFNDRFDGELNCNVCYDGEYIHLNEIVDIRREWSFFLHFKSSTMFTPFRTEWRVYDTKAQIAGTIDFVCACNDGTYEIYDWKRSNKIDPMEVNRFQSGLHGLEHLTDTTYMHYCLQQNLYRYMLEKNYGLNISRMNLVVLHPDYDDFRIVPIKRMDKEVNIIINTISK